MHNHNSRATPVSVDRPWNSCVPRLLRQMFHVIWPFLPHRVGGMASRGGRPACDRPLKPGHVTAQGLL